MCSRSAAVRARCAVGRGRRSCSRRGCRGWSCRGGRNHMLMPKRVKFRKAHRGRMRGEAQRGATVAFGEYGLQAIGRGWIAAQQIEASRRAVTRFIKRGGKLWIRVFPDKPVTKKPAETRPLSEEERWGVGRAVVRAGRSRITPGGMWPATAGPGRTEA